MRIIEAKKSEVNFSNLEPGDVFEFEIEPNKMCKGIRTANNGFLHVENIYGKSTFEVFADAPCGEIRKLGTLVGLEVE